MKTSQKLLVEAHLRHSVGKLQDIGIENLSGYKHINPVSAMVPRSSLCLSQEDPPCLMKSLR